MLMLLLLLIDYDDGSDLFTKNGFNEHGRPPTSTSTTPRPPTASRPVTLATEWNITQMHINHQSWWFWFVKGFEMGSPDCDALFACREINCLLRSTTCREIKNLILIGVLLPFFPKITLDENQKTMKDQRNSIIKESQRQETIQHWLQLLTDPLALLIWEKGQHRHGVDNIAVSIFHSSELCVAGNKKICLAQDLFCCIEQTRQGK